MYFQFATDMGLKPGNKVPHYLVSGERHNKPKPYPGTGLSISAKEFNDRLARSGYAKGNAIDMIMKDFREKKTSYYEWMRDEFFDVMKSDFQKEWNRIHELIMSRKADGSMDGPDAIAYSLHNLPFFEESGDFRYPVPYKSTTDIMEKKKFVPGNLVIIESRIPGWFDDGSDMTVLTPGVIRKPKPDDEDYHLDPENCYMVEFLYLGMEMRTATIGKDRIKLRK